MARALMRYRRRMAYTAVLFAVALGVCYPLFITVWQYCRIKMIRLEFPVSGTINRTVPVTAWLVKSESLLTAPAAGRLTLLARDGERVRVGEAVARIDGAAGFQLLHAPSAGVWCTHVDGLETVLRPAALDALDLNRLEKLDGSTVRPADGTTVEKGGPVGKLVDNLSPIRLVLKVPKNESGAGRPIRGTPVSLIWQGGGLSGRVDGERENGDFHWLVLSVSNYPDSLVHYRRINAGLVTGQLSGYLVPAGALVEYNGKTGLYIVSRQIVHWVPVRVCGEQNGRVAVTGDDLNDGVQVVLNPRWAREGDWLH